MLKNLLLAMVIIVAPIASSQAHCGSCDHKDDKKEDKKDGAKKELVIRVQL